MAAPFLRKDSGYALKELPKGLNKPSDGDWVVMSAELPADRDGDIIRVKGMKVPSEIPLLAQHIRRTADGSPTVIGKLVESMDSSVNFEGKQYVAKLGRFVWAPGELAAKYKQLWPDFLNKVSVGARIKSWEPMDPKDPFGGCDYTETELFELSIVTIPANPAAGVLRALNDTLGGELDPEIASAVKDITAITDNIDEKFTKLIKHIDSRYDLLESMYTQLAARSEGAAPPTASRKGRKHSRQMKSLVRMLNEQMRSLSKE